MAPGPLGPESFGAGWGEGLTASPVPSGSALGRNLRQESSGLADEINFEDFLTIMSYFRPIEMNMDEEQLDRFRKEKLKCEARLRARGSRGVVGQRGLTLPPPSCPCQSSSTCTTRTTTGRSHCRSTEM